MKRTTLVMVCTWEMEFMGKTMNNLLTRLSYDPTSGIVTWKDGKRKGQRAGGLDPRGYRVIAPIDGWFLEHRLIFALMGEAIPEEVDHIDRNRSNNTWSNLRASTCEENNQNKGAISTSKTGIKGVSPIGNGTWRGSVYYKGNNLRKTFKCIIDAEKWVIEKRKELHGKFAYIGDSDV